MNHSLLQKIDQNWTLFIDRDGVINDEKDADYINTLEEFQFYEGVKESFKIFSSIFKYILIITNQRGVARGRTKIKDLHAIHDFMTSEIESNGGRIDKIYFCPDLESPNRKPNPGMGLQALKDFPDIDLNKSVMIGNTQSDMQFGRNLGVNINIFLRTTRMDVPFPNPLIDLEFNTLREVAGVLESFNLHRD